MSKNLTPTERTHDPTTDELLDAILLSSRALVAVSARSIAGVKRVTLPQFRMLVVLQAGEMKLTALADALDVAPSTATRMVDRLVEAGLVSRSVPPGDRRAIQLSLTAAGRRAVRTVISRRRRDLSLVVEQIPASRRAAVSRAMSDFAAAAEKVWPTRGTLEP